MNKTDENPSTLPGPWPWYVLLAAGHVLSGLFPWLMVLWAVFRRGNRRTAFLGLILNLAVYGLFSAYMVKSKIPWWWLLSSVYGIDLIWAVSAWLFQRRFLGTASPRYVWSERSAWIAPLVIGLVIGVCLSIASGIPHALTERNAMHAARDILDRDSVLWDFLRNGWKGIPMGMLLGLWWAGEQRRFSASHIITFLLAYFLTILFMWGTGLFLLFVLCEGAVKANMLSVTSDWVLSPPWVGGLPKALEQIHKHDFLDFLVIPLLFGAAYRLRDFCKRLLWLPAVVLVTLPFLFVQNEWWNVFQSRIVSDMSSSGATRRASAYDNAEQLLKRYPEHIEWPLVAESLARYRYRHGRADTAGELYQTMIRRFQGSNRWDSEVGRAQAALSSKGFGHPADDARIEIPMVDYETYLTHNWMALLSVIRYWEGPQVPESSIKIRLKSLSKSEDKILLNPLATIADLDDAAQSLHYQMTVLPSDLKDLKALIGAGMPVILVDKGRFRLIYGFDESRSSVLAYGFESVSYLTRQEARKEAKEILALKVEGHGESRNRLDRIRHEAETEYSAAFWEGRILGYRAPFMVAIHPQPETAKIAQALGKSPDAIVRESKGFVASFIGLAFLQHADPVRALEWAKISGEFVSSPLPLHVGEVSRLYWRSRDKKVKTRLPFQDQFRELAGVEDYFDEPENVSFLEKAGLKLDADLNDSVLPYFVLEALESTLVSKDVSDQDLLIRLGHGRVALDPSDKSVWMSLGTVCEHASYRTCVISALEGLIAADPLNSEAKLHLAYELVLSGEYGKAESVLAVIDREKVRYDADYPFCRGAIAEWKNNPDDALKKYKKAIDMRRYKPAYHLHHGRLLMASGRKEEAIKALRWAVEIDASGNVRKQAEELLSEIKN